MPIHFEDNDIITGATEALPQELAHSCSASAANNIQDIAPSRAWDQSIEGAIESCKAGVIVIGRRWLAPDPADGKPRLFRDDDVVRSEISRLIKEEKAVFPLLVEGATLPEASDLPEDMRSLLRLQATSIDNAGWEVTMARLIREVEQVIREAEALVRREP